MKTESEQVPRWDDIIFENRNKDYGAYAIRKNYNDSVLKAEAISIGIGILIFVVPILMPKEQILPTVIDEPKGGIEWKDFKVKQENPPSPKPPMRKMDASIIPTRVTTEQVIDEPITKSTTDEVAYTTGPETGTTESTTDGTVDFGNEIPIEVPTEPFSIVEIMPEYVGGEAAMMKFIQKKMRYPTKAQRRGDQGTVYVSFVVSADGSVTDVKIVKGIGKECDEEAVRVISMMDKWRPGVQNKIAVPVRKVLPIKFKLDY